MALPLLPQLLIQPGDLSVQILDLVLQRLQQLLGAGRQGRPARRVTLGHPRPLVELRQVVVEVVRHHVQAARPRHERQ